MIKKTRQLPSILSLTLALSLQDGWTTIFEEDFEEEDSFTSTSRCRPDDNNPSFSTADDSSIGWGVRWYDHIQGYVAWPSINEIGNSSYPPNFKTRFWCTTYDISDVDSIRIKYSTLINIIDPDDYLKLVVINNDRTIASLTHSARHNYSKWLRYDTGIISHIHPGTLTIGFEFSSDSFISGGVWIDDIELSGYREPRCVRDNGTGSYKGLNVDTRDYRNPKQPSIYPTEEGGDTLYLDRLRDNANIMAITLMTMVIISCTLHRVWRGRINRFTTWMVCSCFLLIGCQVDTTTTERSTSHTYVPSLFTASYQLPELTETTIHQGGLNNVIVGTYQDELYLPLSSSVKVMAQDGGEIEKVPLSTDISTTNEYWIDQTNNHFYVAHNNTFVHILKSSEVIKEIKFDGRTILSSYFDDETKTFYVATRTRNLAVAQPTRPPYPIEGDTAVEKEDTRLIELHIIRDLALQQSIPLWKGTYGVKEIAVDNKHGLIYLVAHRYVNVPDDTLSIRIGFVATIQNGNIITQTDVGGDINDAILDINHSQNLYVSHSLRTDLDDPPLPLANQPLGDISVFHAGVYQGTFMSEPESEYGGRYRKIDLHPHTGEIYIFLAGPILMLLDYANGEMVTVGKLDVDHGLSATIWNHVVDPITGNLYLPNFNEDKVDVFNRDRYIGQLWTDMYPFYVSVDPRDGTVYVTNMMSRSLQVFTLPEFDDDKIVWTDR